MHIVRGGEGKLFTTDSTNTNNILFIERKIGKTDAEMEEEMDIAESIGLRQLW